MSRQERRCIIYSITVDGRGHDVESVTEWGLEALIDLFSQEGYTVKDHRPPVVISIRIPPKPKAVKT